MAIKDLESKLLGDDRPRERITLLLVFSCSVATAGGLLYGYESSISGGPFLSKKVASCFSDLPPCILNTPPSIIMNAGGVTSMESFLEEFFPQVYADMKQDSGSRISNYCKFNSQLLTLFTSSVYIAGLFASLLASHTTARFGRRFSMRVGGALVFAGAAISAAAISFYMLILGRIVLGFGLGFVSQSVPVYLSEIAPAQYRGAIFNIYDICFSVAMLMANLINYSSRDVEAHGWRISLGTAAIPSAFFAAGSLLIPDTPTSVIQRRRDLREASILLQRIRGSADISNELNQIIAAAAEAPISKSMGLGPLLRITRKKYRPHLVMAVALRVFQHLAGITLVGRYAPVIFRSVGVKQRSSLLSATVMSLVSTAANLVATPLVDRLGRRAFFFVGGMLLLVALVAAGAVMSAHLGDEGAMSEEFALLMLAIFCFFVTGYSWSWGPLPLLLTSEIFPLGIRSAGKSVSEAVDYLLTAVMAQSMLSMLCCLKWGIFFFFAGCMLLMTVFVYLFLPETKGLKLEEMNRVWMEHWYWKRFVQQQEKEEEEEENGHHRLPLLS